MRVCDANKLIQLAYNKLQEFKNGSANRDHLRHEIDAILDNFTEDTVRALQKKLTKIGKKRKRLRNCRLSNQSRKAEILAERRKKELEIDQWLLRTHELDIQAKMEDSMRRQADTVLQNIRKQKIEAKRYLKLLPALLKLRQLRQKESEPDQNFVKTIQKLKGLWENQYDEYCKEETKLKETLTKGSDQKLATAERELGQILEEWEQRMFGEIFNNKINFQNLVTVRQQWDQFITNDSSTIPAGWLFPQPLKNTWKNSVNFY